MKKTNNKTPNNTIVLIEIGGSHAECLLMQMHAIRKKNHKIILVCTKAIKDRNPIFKSYIDEFFIVDLTGSKIDKRRMIKAIWNKLKETQPEKVVFNTAQGNYVRSLCLYSLISNIKFTGIIHTTRMFKGSITQKIISLKIKKYLLLSQHLLSTITPPRGIEIDYFYPLRFPDYNNNIQKTSPIITIIGGVENKRRDLTGFFTMLLSIKDLNVKFIFLGKTNKLDKEVIEFRDKLNSHNLRQKIISFDDYVPQDIFDAYLKASDLIFPLIHPGTPSAGQYFKNQISGAMTLSFGYKVPLFLHEEYSNIDEMSEASFYYTETTFANDLKEALQHCRGKSREMHKKLQYNIEHQEHKYTNFILAT